MTSTEFSDVVTPSPICPQLFNPFPLSGDVIFECSVNAHTKGIWLFSDVVEIFLIELDPKLPATLDT